MSEAIDLSALVHDVDLLCLDAGNTLVFLDHARLAALCGRLGFATTSDAIERAEGRAKIEQEQGRALEVDWAHAGEPGARAWGLYVGTILRGVGVLVEDVSPLLDAVWLEHSARNLWDLVPPGLVPALGRARAAGVPVAVVSNAEGKLDGLLIDVGVRPAVDLVLDSSVVGVAKPDPGIFQLALDHFGVAPARALHVGDNYATDVLGARAAGLRVALVDPFGHLAGRHADVPRVPGAREVADAIAKSR
jgi:HAD superfamily hydrolase (TIGR01509 family)